MASKVQELWSPRRPREASGVLGFGVLGFRVLGSRACKLSACDTCTQESCACAATIDQVKSAEKGSHSRRAIVPPL